ncbi:hypothetical protein E2C01_041462 [Portunus trituberculatus]|uniref:Uncharacterized protein n=1 Tax=Portunus trituberculatus TaxID=210409 RepID=A0A5B7FRY9_PORTR|nr:hypothetical protein [Portunus trituberculatus]
MREQWIEQKRKEYKRTWRNTTERKRSGYAGRTEVKLPLAKLISASWVHRGMVLSRDCSGVQGLGHITGGGAGGSGVCH